MAARRTGGRSDAGGRVGAVHRKKARPDPAPLPGRTTGLIGKIYIITKHIVVKIERAYVLEWGAGVWMENLMAMMR